MFPSSRRLSRAARVFVTWLLLVAVPLYGLSGALVELLGTQHVHRDEGPRVVAAQTVDEAMANWHFQDVRRSSVSLSAQPRAGSQAHSHAHERFVRHHHARGDASVIALDDAAQGGGAADDGGTAAAATHVLALAAGRALRVPALPPFRWPPPPAARIASVHLPLLDRPPTA